MLQHNNLYTDELFMSDLLKIENHDKAVVIYIVGSQVNMYNIPELEAALEPILTEKPKTIVLDLAKVSYLDSSAMGAIFRMNNTIKGYEGNFYITGVNSTISMVLKITRSDSLLKIFKTVKDALVHA